MSTGLISNLLSIQPQTSTPAGQMEVKMLPREYIMRNPDNKIYVVGDIDKLKEDIRLHGVRQPLEVIRWANGYKLIGGERRLTACEELAKEGDNRFESLPCVIVESKGELDDKIALITANATARDLTDGERLAQYEALKDALAKKKAAGQLEGKVRDEVCRILGLSTGAAARLNVIASCENEYIKERLKAGEIGLMEAYRSAQDYARYMGTTQEEPEQKGEPECVTAQSTDAAATTEENAATNATAETLTTSANAEDANASTRAMSRCPYESDPAGSEEGSSVPLPSATGVSETIPKATDFDAKETRNQPNEQARGRNTLYKLAEKTLGANAAWELAWEDVRFRLAYYKQPLPGAATLWKRIDTTREDAEQTCDDYAIILQDNSFFTCGWICFHSGITDILTDYFELK